MNKSELIDAIVDKTGTTKTVAEGTINALLEVISDALKKKEEVRFVGFGTFKNVLRKATTGRNPRDGKEIKIPESNRPKFVPGKNLIDSLN